MKIGANYANNQQPAIAPQSNHDSIYIFIKISMEITSGKWENENK